MRAHRTITTTAAVVTLAFLALLSTGTHTVTPGESLSGIAARYGTSTAELARANGLADPNRIYAGTRLTIPGAPTAATTSYRVEPGDTLGRIASRHGTSIAAVVALNEIVDANLILAGQVLQLPAGPAAGTPVSAPAGGATSHVVQAGDTISGIAARYGISQAQLIEANGLTGGTVYRGQRLSLVPVNSGGSTTLICPVQGGARLMNDWGFPRSGGRFHEGNDLFAPRGTPVVAVVGGTAVQTTGRLGGNQVKLAGDDGVSYYFTHLHGFGNHGRVAAGDVIGSVGSSGNAAGGPPHLHFEVHPGGGAAVNPYPRIAGAC